MLLEGAQRDGPGWTAEVAVPSKHTKLIASCYY